MREHGQVGTTESTDSGQARNARSRVRRKIAHSGPVPMGTKITTSVVFNQAVQIINTSAKNDHGTVSASTVRRYSAMNLRSTKPGFCGVTVFKSIFTTKIALLRNALVGSPETGGKVSMLHWSRLPRARKGQLTTRFYQEPREMGLTHVQTFCICARFHRDSACLREVRIHFRV